MSWPISVSLLAVAGWIVLGCGVWSGNGCYTLINSWGISALYLFGVFRFFWVIANSPTRKSISSQGWMLSFWKEERSLKHTPLWIIKILSLCGFQVQLLDHYTGYAIGMLSLTSEQFSPYSLLKAIVWITVHINWRWKLYFLNVSKIFIPSCKFNGRVLF